MALFLDCNRFPPCISAIIISFSFSSHVGVPGKSDGVIFTPVKTEIVSFAPELVGGEH